MVEAGDRRPPRRTPPDAARRPSGWARLYPRTRWMATAEALVVALLASAAWAVIRGIFEFPGVLAVAVVAGWAIGTVLWPIRAHPLLAAGIAAGAWLGGLVLTWLLAMAILPGSSRTFLERVQATPFLEWQAPQFGAIELLGLVLYVLAALYGARPRTV